MRIHKDSSSSAVLKRKAEDNGDGSESKVEDKPKQGHKTKRVKPTCGYIPGTGNPYRGTMRDTPIPQPTVPARALENKPTNTLLKHRESLAKQDTKNLNRNAPKPKVPWSVGDSSPCHVPWADTVNVEGHKPSYSESTNSGPVQSGGARSHGRVRRWPS